MPIGDGEHEFVLDQLVHIANCALHLETLEDVGEQVAAVRIIWMHACCEVPSIS